MKFDNLNVNNSQNSQQSWSTVVDAPTSPSEYTLRSRHLSPVYTSPVYTSHLRDQPGVHCGLTLPQLNDSVTCPGSLSHSTANWPSRNSRQRSLSAHNVSASWCCVICGDVTRCRIISRHVGDRYVGPWLFLLLEQQCLWHDDVTQRCSLKATHIAIDTWETLAQDRQQWRQAIHKWKSHTEEKISQKYQHDHNLRYGLPDALAPRIFCIYCDRDFAAQIGLISHRWEKHKDMIMMIILVRYALSVCSPLV